MQVQLGTLQMDAQIQKTVLAFFKRPQHQIAVPYSQIASVEYGTVWSIAGLLSALLISALTLMTMQLYGLIFVALIVLESYDHAVIIRRTDGTKVKLYGPSGGDAFIDDLRNRLQVAPIYKS
ncbi:MAG: hypothetical protein IJ705_09965 [Oscillospiraceae bacterium]|nr:hypothetical protein [Oscillospiraceae bacterium]